MRKLMVKQKKVLDRIIANDMRKLTWDDLSAHDIYELEKINDTEILWSEVNRYLHYKAFNN